jgi:hypothetical protein
MMQDSTSEEARRTGLLGHISPTVATRGDVQRNITVSPTASGPDALRTRANAATPWEPQMRRAPFSDHKDADIARWSI